MVVLTVAAASAAQAVNLAVVPDLTAPFGSVGLVQDVTHSAQSGWAARYHPFLQMRDRVCAVVTMVKEGLYRVAGSHSLDCP